MPVAGLRGAVAISAGWRHTLAIGAASLDPIGESASATVAAGGILSTDTEADGATPQDPLETSVTAAVGGDVSITEGPMASPSTGTGYSFAGQQVQISAPAATAGNPNTISFRLDESQIPIGQSAGDLKAFRNGELVGDCTGSPGVASPDPCVASRETLADGDLEIVILTSQASVWNLGFAAPERVDIEVNPDEGLNLITLRSRLVEVSILSTADFDATTRVAPESLRFGRTGDEDSLKLSKKGKAACDEGDVDGDGLADLTCAFDTASTDLSPTDFEGVITGQTVDEVPIEGRQLIIVEDPHK